MSASTRHADRSLLLLLTLVVLALAPPAYAQTTFATDLDFVIGVTQLDDERILVVQGGESGNVLAFDPDGTSLPSFVGDIAGPGDVAQLADGRVLLSTFANQNVLAFDSDGTPLPSFAEGLVGPVSPVQLDDGRVLVAEQFAGNVVAFNADGTGRASFASELDFPNQVVQLQDGRVLVAASLPSGGLVLAFDPDGTALPDFATVDFPVGALTQLADGRILAAQLFGGDIAAFDPDGTALPDFGTAGADPRAMTQLADGRVLVTDQAGTILAFEVDTTPSAFAQIQRHPDTRDYGDAFGTNGPGAILELPDGSLAVFYDVQTTFDDFGPSRLYVSTTADGVTWSAPEELDASVNWQSLAVPQGAVDVVTGRILLTYDRDGVSQALYSDDNGTTWTNTPIPTALFGGRAGFITDLAAAPGGGFVAMTQTFGDSDETLEAATSPDGITWSTPSQIAEGFLCDGSVVQTSATDFVTLYSECFFSFGDPWPMLQRTSTDGGASWGEVTEAFVSEVSFGRRVDMTRAADGTLWAVHTNSEDLFYTSSTDGGATWAASERWTDNDRMVGDDFQPAITMYDGDPMALFISRGGRDTEFEAFYYGIPGLSEDPLTVAIEPVSTASPDGLALAQNYPNPFVSSTTISFSVHDTAPTHLVVYDLLGREVARLVDQTLTPGTYEVTFDRSALASGVYVYQLVSGATSAHRTMTLVD